MSISESVRYGGDVGALMDLAQPPGDDYIASLYTDNQLGLNPTMSQIEKAVARLMADSETAIYGLALALNRYVDPSELEDNVILGSLSRQDLEPEYRFLNLLMYRGFFEPRRSQ